ncbi:MAG: DMT family transporter [Clostridiales bacterium]|jgi:drug/metabolite transporter (DMT)-like permease|nr:DMT family transporter [Clostridiales bacterium]
MHSKSKGIVFMILASGIFGFTPILARLSFEGGANGITMVFLRAVISLPLLALIIKIKKIPFKIPGDLVKQMLICGIFASLTAILLYSSFNYIDVGLAVTIHFINPALVVLASALFFREKMQAHKWVALALVMTGVLLLMEAVTRTGPTGIVLAFLSGVSLAAYILALGRSDLHRLHYLTITFYLCVMVSIGSLVFGLASGHLTFALTPMAWFYAFLISVLVSIFAVTFFQLGVIKAGPSTASLVSCLEPITGIAFGVIILSEILTPLRALGGALIIISVAVISIAGRSKDYTSSTQEGSQRK